MSDVLPPAEQARAHRLSAQALYERNPTSFQASRYALREIADHLDPPEPPETVESLRAERDTALTNARTWEELADGWREQFRLVCDESEDHKKQADEATARLRDVLAADAAHAHAEAARGRCARED